MCKTISGRKGMKILNLYAGVGGNRKLWGEKHEITAVELNASIAAAYKDLYPNDNVIIADAHDFLPEHYKEFDFIWSSPPCQSHSQKRVLGVNYGNTKAIYPDMKLYQEILFLQLYAKCDWAVENVIPYYKPLVTPSFVIGRHYFWSNKFIINSEFVESSAHLSKTAVIADRKQIDISKYKFDGIDRRQVLRNCTEPELGLYILEQLTGEKQ
jgi:DNA (cytosine-5)-methyltransferase 1